MLKKKYSQRFSNFLHKKICFEKNNYKHFNISKNNVINVKAIKVLQY